MALSTGSRSANSAVMRAMLTVLLICFAAGCISDSESDPGCEASCDESSAVSAHRRAVLDCHEIGQQKAAKAVNAEPFYLWSACLSIANDDAVQAIEQKLDPWNHSALSEALRANGLGSYCGLVEELQPLLDDDRNYWKCMRDYHHRVADFIDYSVHFEGASHIAFSAEREDFAECYALYEDRKDQDRVGASEAARDCAYSQLETRRNLVATASQQYTTLDIQNAFTAAYNAVNMPCAVLSESVPDDGTGRDEMDVFTACELEGVGRLLDQVDSALASR